MACIKSVFNKLELENELGRDTKRLLVDVPAILSFFCCFTYNTCWSELDWAALSQAAQ